MKLKCLAIVGVLLMAAPAMAFERTETKDFTPAANVSIVGEMFSLLAGNYTFSLSASGTGNGNSGTIAATLLKIVGGFEEAVQVAINGKTTVTDVSAPFSLSAGNYRIDWLATNVKGGVVTANAVLTGQTVAVPGPEAGAGIGALAMAGIAYAVSRRRKTLPAA